VLAPLAGAVVAGAGRWKLRDRCHWAAIAGVAVAFLASLVILFQIPGAGQDAHGDQHGQVAGVAYADVSATVPVYEWLTSGAREAGAAASTWFRIEFLIDPLTAIMLCTVTGISLLVIIYSRDYMREHDKPQRGYERFFAYMALFVFSMCALVLGGNFLLLYLGWEAVGLCSYLLIGFYYGRPAAAAAMKKAFLVNRVGDFGFGLGIFLIYLTFGTLQYDDVFRLATQGIDGAGNMLEQSRITAIALLLFCGACGKSAQLPLHVWLPDAMEGPSPVSALIHAATMVTAGVYMVCLLYTSPSPRDRTRSRMPSSA